MQGCFILPSCKICLLDIVAIRLVNRNGIGQLHNALFHSLKFISRTGNHQHQEKIDH